MLKLQIVFIKHIIHILLLERKFFLERNIWQVVIIAVDTMVVVIIVLILVHIIVVIAVIVAITHTTIIVRVVIAHIHQDIAEFLHFQTLREIPMWILRSIKVPTD